MTTPWERKALQAYLEAALWADWPEEDGDTPTIYQIAPNALAQATSDVQRFSHLVASEARDDAEEYDATDMGRLLWLTRNGHGSGFWEYDSYPKSFSDIASKMGAVYPFRIGRNQWGLSI